MVEGIDRKSDVTEEYRAVADKFIGALGHSRVRYVGAEAAPSSGTVWLTIRADEEEVSGPASRVSTDVDDFKSRFRELHRTAFDLLPTKVEIVLQLQRTPDATSFLTLDL